VWFPGAHADVRGGYIAYDLRGSEGLAALDDITLDWMLRRVRHYFPQFPLKPELLRNPSSETSIAQQHEARTGMYCMKPFALRSMCNYPVPVSGKQLCVSFDRRATPTGEMVHISALERLGKQVAVDGKKQSYQPKNLLGVIKRVQDTYSDTYPGSNMSSETIDIPVVDWSGEVLEPTDPGARNKVRDMLHRCQISGQHML
jgi:hypothetical protein